VWKQFRNTQSVFFGWLLCISCPLMSYHPHTIFTYLPISCSANNSAAFSTRSYRLVVV
jgi:hypothetical protein